MKINKFLFVSAALIFLAVVSCKEDTSPFEGAWSGTYSGGDSGTWNVNIDSDGEITGSATSVSLPAFPFDLSGNVNDQGDVNAEIDLIISTVFLQGTFSENAVSGTWTNPQDSLIGVWQGTKK